MNGLQAFSLTTKVAITFSLYFPLFVTSNTDFVPLGAQTVQAGISSQNILSSANVKNSLIVTYCIEEFGTLSNVW